MARSVAHRVVNYSYGSTGPHAQRSITSETCVTQTAFEVANEASQMFGGNGLTQEHPLEKSSATPARRPYTLHRGGNITARKDARVQ